MSALYGAEQQARGDCFFLTLKRYYSAQGAHGKRMKHPYCVLARRCATEKGNDAYFALLVERNSDAYAEHLDAWRIEFQLNREGAKGFWLYAAPEVEDDDLDLDAELAAEDLEHIGTLPRFFAHRDQVWHYLIQHWLRLVIDNGTANCSRWPLDPTWAIIQEAYTTHAPTRTAPLDEKGWVVVRGLRYSGKNRVLRRLTLDVTASLEVEDASPVSTRVTLQMRWARGKRLHAPGWDSDRTPSRPISSGAWGRDSTRCGGRRSGRPAPYGAGGLHQRGHR